MHSLVPRQSNGLSSPFRHPRFVIGGSALTVLLLVEFVASLLMGQLT